MLRPWRDDYRNGTPAAARDGMAARSVPERRRIGASPAIARIAAPSALARWQPLKRAVLCRLDSHADLTQAMRVMQTNV